MCGNATELHARYRLENSLQGIPSGGEGPYIMSSDSEEACRIPREVIISIADSLGNPRGDSSRLDLLCVTWLVGYEEAFPAFI